MKKAMLVTAAVMVAGCAPRGSENLEDVAIVPAEVVDALSAKLEGWGGCLAPSEVRSIIVDAFPQVHFWQGGCRFEHGTRGQAVVATDSSGVLYLLASEAGFRFLVDRQRPTIAPLDDPVEYGGLALKLMGSVGWTAEPIRTRGEVPGQIREALGATGLREVRSEKRSDATSTMAPTWITMLSDEGLERFSVLVEEDGGVTVVESRLLWSAAAVH